MTSKTSIIPRVDSSMTEAPSDDESSYCGLHRTAADALLSQLTQQEIELAARAASYEYLCQQQQQEQEQPTAASEQQQQQQQQQRVHAQTFVQRFLNSTSNPDKALERVKATLAFRQASQVDDLRTAFDNDAYINDSNNKTKLALEEHLASKSLYVQGYDKQGRATYYFVTRNVQQHDQEWTLKAHVYTLERALACSRSGAVNAVIDFNGFSLAAHAPPMAIGKQFMQVFREHYAGAIHQIYLVDAPLAFYALWNVLKHFVGTKTRSKIHFVSAEQAQQRLGDLYEANQLPTWLGGTNDREFDLDEYLYHTPFDAAFGDALLERE